MRLGSSCENFAPPPRNAIGLTFACALPNKCCARRTYESRQPIRHSHSPAGFRPRLDELDLLRGAVMIIMALDHARDFVSHDAMFFDPTDLTKTHGWLFLTRWITHFCAPVFVFLAGTGAFLSLGRGKSKRDLSWFLVTRGAWLVFLELTVVNSSWFFGFDPHFFFLQVIWAIGWSMIVLAALIHLPLWGVATFGLVMIGGHNLLDPISPAAWGSWSGFWKVLHVQAPVVPAPGFLLFIAYPLIPWLGVIAAGFAFGGLMKMERPTRRRVLLWLGLGITAGFVLLRATNLYGDPSPWSVQQSTPLHGAFVFELHEISALVALPDDDAGAGAHLPFALRSRTGALVETHRRLRSGTAFLLFAARAADPWARDPAVVSALWPGGPNLARARRGRREFRFPGGFRIWAARRLRSVGSRDSAALSALPLVC